MSLVPVAVLDWPAGPDTRAQWAGLVAGAGIEEEALEAEQEMTNRHCRLAELLRQVRSGRVEHRLTLFWPPQHSSEAELAVVTLPLPRLDTPPALYCAWLDLLTRSNSPLNTELCKQLELRLDCRELPPVLLVRGNQQSVLTFYS